MSPRWNGAKDQLLDIGYQKSVKRGGPFHEFLVEDQAQPDGRTPRKSVVCIDRNITVLRNSDEKDEKNKKEGQKDESALESAKVGEDIYMQFSVRSPSRGDTTHTPSTS